MILPHTSLNTSLLTRITSTKQNSRKILSTPTYWNSDLKHKIGHFNTTEIQSAFEFDLHHSDALQVTPSLGETQALASKSISSLTEIYNTTLKSVEYSLNSTHSTMTTNIVSAFMENTAEEAHEARNRVMLLVLIGIFMFISLFITIVVFVMCKKKNSIFMLQKCEQESDLELDEIEEVHTEVDTSESEYEQIADSGKDLKHSESYPCLGKLKYMEESFDDGKSMQQKTRSTSGFLKNTWTSGYSLSPSSTPLLQKSSPQTGSQGKLATRQLDGDLSNTSLDLLTGSKYTDKHVVVLDKYSIHSPQIDSDIEQLTPSSEINVCVHSQAITRSQTPDLANRNKTDNFESGKSYLQPDLQRGSSSKHKKWPNRQNSVPLTLYPTSNFRIGPNSKDLQTTN